MSHPSLSSLSPLPSPNIVPSLIPVCPPQPSFLTIHTSWVLSKHSGAHAFRWGMRTHVLVTADPRSFSCERRRPRHNLRGEGWPPASLQPGIYLLVLLSRDSLPSVSQINHELDLLQNPLHTTIGMMPLERCGEPLEWPMQDENERVGSAGPRQLANCPGPTKTSSQFQGIEKPLREWRWWPKRRYGVHWGNATSCS